ncbi:hypothetical protein ACJX0J_005691 [Zea mays]
MLLIEYRLIVKKYEWFFIKILVGQLLIVLLFIFSIGSINFAVRAISEAVAVGTIAISEGVVTVVAVIWEKRIKGHFYHKLFQHANITITFLCQKTKNHTCVENSFDTVGNVIGAHSTGYCILAALDASR